jgi:hypothetical protein
MRYSNFQEAAEAAMALAREQGRNVSLRRDGEEFLVDEDQPAHRPQPVDEGSWRETIGRVDPDDPIPF